MKVVFDTNIFVSAFAVRGSQGEQAVQRIIDGHDQLFISRPILLELMRVLSEKFGQDREQVARTAIFVSDLADTVRPRAKINILADEPDNRILECAATAKAEIIVTGDRVMLGLKDYGGVRIVTLKDYLDGDGT